ncbi:hypothetical protein V493_00953 [Pseudogymnoascus sp. VKM F-4281 (FW-2241)]|nr:hypothetical protein V493_00953 [Pseudogymnoascus sp. VKM F-4281 (FW-2241)]
MDNGSIEWKDGLLEKDLAIGVKQEDLTIGPIFESELEPELELEALIDPRLQQAPEPSSSSDPELEPEQELDSGLRIEPGIELSGSELEPEQELDSELSRLVPT